MIRTAFRAIFVAAGLAMLSLPAAAASQAEAEAAVSAAEAIETQAIEAKAAWTTTEKFLKTAKTALESGDWDAAKAAADEAQALAKLSIDQANEEKELWPLAVFH